MYLLEKNPPNITWGDHVRIKGSNEVWRVHTINKRNPKWLIGLQSKSFYFACGMNCFSKENILIDELEQLTQRIANKRLVPLEQNNNMGMGSTKLHCPVTGKVSEWNDAAKEGWMLDLDAKSVYDAYYSPESIANLFQA